MLDDNGSKSSATATINDKIFSKKEPMIMQKGTT